MAIVAAVSLLIAFGTGGSAYAAGVSTTVPCTGSGGGTAGLITAIINADFGGGGTITLASACDYTFTSAYANPSPAVTGTPPDLADWYGPAALPAIAASITIVGNGSTIGRSTAPGTPDFRLFFIGADPTAAATPSWTTPGAGTLVLEDLTLSGGLAQGGDGDDGGGGLGAGGAVYNQGTTVLSAVTLSGNIAQGGSGAGTGTGTGGGGTGADAATGSNDGGGFGTGFTEPASFPTGGGGFILGLGAGGGGAGFGTGENGTAGLLTGAGAGGGALTGTAGDGETGHAAAGGDGGGGASGSVALTAGRGGDYGAGGTGETGGGAGGGGVGGGGGGATAGAGGGFGGGGGYPGGEGGFGGGGAGTSGGAGFGGGAGSSAAAGGGGAGMGGAVFNQQGTLIAENATLSGNTATGGTGGSGATAGQGLGGAIFSLNGGVALINDTIASNTADDGGALYVVGYDASSASTAGSAALVNDILSGSVTAAQAGTHDLVVSQPSTVADGTANQAVAAASVPSTNIVDTTSGTVTGGPSAANPNLGPLANNGGPGMLTMLPLTGSPALGAGSATGAPATDERGTARPAGGPIDLGAVQVSVVGSFPVPVAVTGLAKSVTSSAATLIGAIDPEGLATTYYFDYGTSTNYGFKSSTETLPAGTTAVPAMGSVSGLKPNTTYHFRIVATNANGSADGLDGTFKTTRQSPAGLTVTTKPTLARKFPYRFAFSGKVRLPKGITSGAACTGKVSIVIKRGKKTVFSGRSSIFAGCGWKLSAKLSKRKAVPGHGSLSVTVSFGGNSVLTPRTNKAFKIRYG